MNHASAAAAFVLAILASDLAIADRQTHAVRGSNLAVGRSIENGDLVRGLDVHIDSVLTGGRWCDGDRSGYFRIVVCEGGFEEVYHWTFIQLIEIDDENHDIKVKDTINIRELSGLDKFIVDLAIDKPDRLTCEDLSVIGVVRVRQPGEDREDSFRVHVSSDSRYRIEPR